jgi:predicted PurR-regulated permease PerM
LHLDEPEHRMPSPTSWTPPRDGWANRVLLVFLTIAALYLGRDVLAPLALALVLGIAALPVVGWMTRHRVPRPLAATAVLLAIVLALLLLLAVVVLQAFALISELPRYETELREKLAVLASGAGPLDRAAELLSRLAAVSSPVTPGPVVVAQAGASPLSTAGALFGALLGPLAMLAVTLLLMTFLLIQQEDMRDRAIRLAGTGRMHLTTRAMHETMERVGRFLLTQLVVNAIFGTLMGMGLWALGVPNAPLWGALAFALRFVPYLGAPLSALFPLAMAFATTPGWTTVLLVLLLFVVVDVFVSFVLEPWLFGASVGITPFALVLAAVFWGTLWGPIGLILAPALTACLAILGRHVPGFAFLEIMLAEGDKLSLAERFAQRLFAGDPDGASRLLDRAATDAGEAEALRSVAEPALLRLAAERGQVQAPPALIRGAARTLLALLREREEDDTGGATLLVAPLGGAVAHAGAALAVAALREAGHGAAVSTPAEADRAQVLVLDAPLRPSARAAHRLGAGRAPARVLALSLDAARSAERAGLPVSASLAELAEALAAELGQPDPVAGVVAAA